MLLKQFAGVKQQAVRWSETEQNIGETIACLKSTQFDA
jgi:hypothetical protein